MTVICPRCRARLDDGIEFTAQQRVDSYRELIVTGVAADGSLLTTGVDHSYGDPRGPLFLQCGACRYEWPTIRRQAYGDGTID